MAGSCKITPDGMSQGEMEEEIPGMPREVRNVIQPVRLGPEDTFTFRCHPGISCFNECCSNIEIVLTPYDMLRLRERLRLTPEEFLFQYADAGFLNKGELPVAMLRMDPESGRCPFNTDEGCSVYSDRPVTCRYYPIGLALMRKEEMATKEEFHFLIKEKFCKGHEERKKWTVASWQADQGTDIYDDLNKGWMEVIIKRRSAGDMTRTSTSIKEMFYTASTNPPTMRRFVFESSFLKRYQVPEDLQEKIRDDDAALTAFAFDWLKSVLFGEKTYTPHPEVVEEVKTKLAAKREARLKALQEQAAQEKSAGAEEGTPQPDPEG